MRAKRKTLIKIEHEDKFAILDDCKYLPSVLLHIVVDYLVFDHALFDPKESYHLSFRWLQAFERIKGRFGPKLLSYYGKNFTELNCDFLWSLQRFMMATLLHSGEKDYLCSIGNDLGRKLQENLKEEFVSLFANNDVFRQNYFYA